MKRIFLSCLVLLFSTLAFSSCMPVAEAGQHLGETRCVQGKVLRVDQPQPGFARLAFCEHEAKCSFTVLVKETDADNFAALQDLQGKTIKIHSLVTGSEGSAQMLLPDSKQLVSDEYGVPSFMKAYDVEERGHYSAGTSHAPKTKKTTTKKQTATLPIDIPEDSETPE